MPNSTPQPISFDARPLTEPVDPNAVRAFAAEMRGRRTPSSSSSGAVVVIIFAVLIIVVFASIMIPMLMLFFRGFGNGGPSFLSLLPALLFVAVVIGGGLMMSVSWRKSKVARYRISRFAAANNMTYEDGMVDPPLPGMIFGLGRSRKSERLVRGHSPRFVEFGNYQYTTGSGKNSTTHYWGYIAVKLDVPLPNIVLDALGNNAVFGTNLPASFQKEQKLSLEGNFDQYFTLYCPSGYEQDALYLFTPDIMARFIDNAAQLDVEIVDDWLFLYTKREASTLDPNTWAWLFSTVGALITKFDQWARWRDDRLLAEQGRTYTQMQAPVQAPAAGGAAVPPVPALPFAAPAGMLTPPPGVAFQGRRLKRRANWIWIVVAVFFFALWIVPRFLFEFIAR